MQRTPFRTGLLVLDLRERRGQLFRVLAHADALAAAALGRLEHDGVLDPFRGRQSFLRTMNTSRLERLARDRPVLLQVRLQGPVVAGVAEGPAPGDGGHLRRLG